MPLSGAFHLVQLLKRSDVPVIKDLRAQYVTTYAPRRGIPFAFEPLSACVSKRLLRYGSVTNKLAYVMSNSLNIWIMHLKRAMVWSSFLAVHREKEGMMIYPFLLSVDVHECGY
jgi:hypothetical protein